MSFPTCVIDKVYSAMNLNAIKSFIEFVIPRPGSTMDVIISSPYLQNHPINTEIISLWATILYIGSTAK